MSMTFTLSSPTGRLASLPFLLLFTLAACDKPQARKPLVLYTSVDEPIARSIVQGFTRNTGIAVVIRTDTEASKTAGLVMRLRAEKDHPQADVFWNNEVFHTINLAAEGVLAPHQSPSSRDVAGQFRDRDGRWTANGYRVRKLALREGVEATTIEDLADPKWKGKASISNPAFGTATGHVASWFVALGADKAEAMLQKFRDNDIQVLGGNSEVVKQVAAGTSMLGLTDNDDVDAMRREGGNIRGIDAVLRDHPGPLAIPCTVSLVSGRPDSEEARKLADYLLSAEVEQELIKVGYIAGSVRGDPGTRVMKVDYTEVAKMLPRAIESSRRILEGRK